MPPTAMQMIHAGKKDPWMLRMGSHPDVTRHQMAPAATHGGRKCPTGLLRSTMKQHNLGLDPAASAGPSLYLADHGASQEDVMSTSREDNPSRPWRVRSLVLVEDRVASLPLAALRRA